MAAGVINPLAAEISERGIAAWGSFGERVLYQASPHETSSRSDGQSRQVGATSEEYLAIHPASRVREAPVEIDLHVQKVEKLSVQGKSRLVDRLLGNE